MIQLPRHAHPNTSLQYLCSTSGRRPMDAARSSRHGSDALQKVFTAAPWLRSRLQHQRSSSQRDRSLPSHWRSSLERGHGHRRAGLHAWVPHVCTTSERTPRSACHGFEAVQKGYTSTTWLGSRLRLRGPAQVPRRRSATELHCDSLALFEGTVQQPATFFRGRLWRVHSLWSLPSRLSPSKKTRPSRADSTLITLQDMSSALDGTAARTSQVTLLRKQIDDNSLQCLRPVQELLEIWHHADTVDSL